MGYCCGQIKVLQIARAHANKLLKINQEISSQRMAICNACELLKDGVCIACGCDMEAKSTLKDSNIKCEHPDGAKW